MTTKEDTCFNQAIMGMYGKETTSKPSDSVTKRNPSITVAQLTPDTLLHQIVIIAGDHPAIKLHHEVAQWLLFNLGICDQTRNFLVHDTPEKAVDHLKKFSAQAELGNAVERVDLIPAVGVDPNKLRSDITAYKGHVDIEQFRSETSESGYKGLQKTKEGFFRCSAVPMVGCWP